MNKLFLFFALLVCNLSIAQYQIAIDAYVLDKGTGSPLEYVNVNVLSKNVSAISNNVGSIKLTYDEDSVVEQDIIKFSHIGYKDLEVKVGLLYKLLVNSNKIYLVKKDFLSANEDSSGGKITGTISDPNGFVQGAIVRVKNTLIETQTDFEGKFAISANRENVIVINALGMLPKEMTVPEAGNISVQLVPDGELLDAIELVGKAKKKLVETAVGKKNQDALGYSVNTISSEDISPGAIFLSDVIRGRFAGIRIDGFGDDAKFIIRGKGSVSVPAPAIFEVDGSIYNELPGFVNVQQIESITILKSLSAVNRYGAIARGGVIRIKTKNFGVPTGEDGKPVDTALVKGNDYNEILENVDDALQESNICIRLENAKSYEEALTIYKEEKSKLKGESVSFMVDASDCFMKWNEDQSVKILKEAIQKAYTNVKALKTIAFKFDEKREFEESKLVYQRIAELRKKDIQSYRDLALSYTNTGNYQEAMVLYKKMMANDLPGVDFMPIENTIINEVQNLVAQHRTEVDYKDLHPDLLSVKFKKDIRIVLDWNDPNAEFEFQFVNPNKKYFKWAHTKFESMDRMMDEIKTGYHTEEYIIDNAEPGEWLVNIEGLTEEDSLNPTYLKYTVYKNYGLPEETKEIKVIKLPRQEKKLTLDRVSF